MYIVVVKDTFQVLWRNNQHQMFSTQPSLIITNGLLPVIQNLYSFEPLEIS